MARSKGRPRLKLLRMETVPLSKDDIEQKFCARRELEYLDLKTRERHKFVVKESTFYYGGNGIQWRVEWWRWHKQSRAWLCYTGEWCTSERFKVEVTIANHLECILFDAPPAL